MKILYFGTVCELEHYFEFIKGSKYTPSVAPIVFESALLEGLFQNNIEIEVLSYPMIPTFPSCKYLYFGRRTEKLPCGYSCRWLNTLNLPIFKQISRRHDAVKIMRNWLKEKAGDGVILTYSIPPFLIKSILKYANRYSIKVIPVVTDLLRDMYANENGNSVLKKFKNSYLKTALNLQGECDGYVYLTEAMRDVVAPDKPYMVMEGIANIEQGNYKDYEKASPRAIMYAGVLHEKYGIINLLKAFEKLNDTQTELWLFGNGTAEEKVKKFAEENPRIKYFGSLPRKEILEYEKKATLLVNPRNPNEEFTKYSFPSKTIEYMLSGTPMLTSRLQGIPEEYFNYVFEAKDNSVDALSDAINKALQYTDEELSAMGNRARQFIIENKSAKQQAERIIHFINDL